jgi:hypothetical protein
MVPLKLFLGSDLSIATLSVSLPSISQQFSKIRIRSRTVVETRKFIGSLKWKFCPGMKASIQ